MFIPLPVPWMATPPTRGDRWWCPRSTCRCRSRRPPCSQFRGPRTRAGRGRASQSPRFCNGDITWQKRQTLFHVIMKTKHRFNRLDLYLLAREKSHILTFELPGLTKRTSQGVRPRWPMPLECMYSRPSNNWRTMRATYRTRKRRCSSFSSLIRFKKNVIGHQTNVGAWFFLRLCVCSLKMVEKQKDILVTWLPLFRHRPMYIRVQVIQH